MNIIKILKDHSFIIYAPLSVFIVTIVNKIILFIHYSLPLDLLKISIEDLYINGIFVSLLIFVLFLIFAGIILVLEMFIVHVLPKKLHKFAYEVILIIYVLYTGCIYSGLVEFFLTGKIDNTKSTTIFISIVFGASIGIGLLLKIITSLIQRKKKNGLKPVSGKSAYIFQEIMDSTGIKKILYIIFAFILLIGLTSSIQLGSLINKHEYLEYQYNDKSYALITTSPDTYIFKSFLNGNIGSECLLINKSETVILKSNK